MGFQWFAVDCAIWDARGDGCSITLRSVSLHPILQLLLSSSSSMFQSLLSSHLLQEDHLLNQLRMIHDQWMEVVPCEGKLERLTRIWKWSKNHMGLLFVITLLARITEKKSTLDIGRVVIKRERHCKVGKCSSEYPGWFYGFREALAVDDEGQETMGITVNERFTSRFFFNLQKIPLKRCKPGAMQRVVWKRKRRKKSLFLFFSPLLSLSLSLSLFSRAYPLEFFLRHSIDVLIKRFACVLLDVCRTATQTEESMISTVKVLTWPSSKIQRVFVLPVEGGHKHQQWFLHSSSSRHSRDDNSQRGF